jgi:hypothetical protein
MSIEAALAALSLATAAGAIRGALGLYLERRREGRVASELKREQLPELSIDSDPRALNEYLLRHAGALSVREYMGDAEARGVVERAIARVDDLLGAAETTFTLSSTAASPQLTRAHLAVERGDVVGALAHLRLGVELELRDVASVSDLPEIRGGLTALVRALTRVGALGQVQADQLISATRVANAALHGEPVQADQAREAIVSADTALRDLRVRWQDRHSE